MNNRERIGKLEHQVDLLETDVEFLHERVTGLLSMLNQIQGSPPMTVPEPVKLSLWQ